MTHWVLWQEVWMLVTSLTTCIEIMCLRIITNVKISINYLPSETYMYSNISQFLSIFWWLPSLCYNPWNFSKQRCVSVQRYGPDWKVTAVAWAQNMQYIQNYSLDLHGPWARTRHLRARDPSWQQGVGSMSVDILSNNLWEGLASRTESNSGALVWVCIITYM